MGTKRNGTLFAACLLFPLLISGCLYDFNDCITRIRYLKRERDPRLDGWWKEDKPDSLFPMVYHFDAKRGIKLVYENYKESVDHADKKEYWYTEENILFTADGYAKGRGDWEHYYRISDDTLEISSEDFEFYPISDVKNWKILLRADSLAQTKNFANE